MDPKNNTDLTNIKLCAVIYRQTNVRGVTLGPEQIQKFEIPLDNELVRTLTNSITKHADNMNPYENLHIQFEAKWNNSHISNKMRPTDALRLLIYLGLREYPPSLGSSWFGWLRGLTKKNPPVS